MSVSLFEMLKNLSYDTRLGDEADHSELATAALTKQRVDFVHRRIRSAHLRRSAALRAVLRVGSSAGWGRGGRYREQSITGQTRIFVAHRRG